MTPRGALVEMTETKALAIDVMFFYGPRCGVLGAKDGPALQRLSCAGIDVEGIPLHFVVDRMMLAASSRGVATNALGWARNWGAKDQHEFKLRRYELATGRIVNRPKTHVARPHELRAVLAAFAKRGEVCLVKPVFGEGGRDFRVVYPGGIFTDQLGSPVVVQRLMPDPFLVAGHKADIRCYLLIDIGGGTSKRLSPIFVRRAAMPYVPASLPAEITNTAYRSMQGLPPDIHPLGLIHDMSANLRAEIIGELNSLMDAFIGAYVWDAARNTTNEITWREPSNRIFLFGIDVFVSNPRNRPRLFFLETNPFPALFRDAAECDHAVEMMLSQEYLPALQAATATKSSTR